jgi:hypothetical protein
VDNELLRQFGVEKVYLETDCRTGDKLEKTVGDKSVATGSHHKGENPTLAAECSHRCDSYGSKGFQQTAPQLVKMSPEVHEGMLELLLECLIVLMLEWLVQSNYSNNQTIKHEKPY